MTTTHGLSKVQGPTSNVRNPQSAIRNSSRFRSFAAALIMTGCLLPVPASAQTMTGGWLLQLYGMVQVEPGSNVVTMDVKKEHIRFVIHNVQCASQDFSIGRFYVETTNREPGLHMKGPEEWLDTLLKERPGKRVLKLVGRYYPDSRVFIIDNLSQFKEERKKEF
ncbi:MAG: hypothetical protein HOP18_02135 [Deltaproteobacteria bacterium]|nr:hypothetical protein [Deltaproteobacteria bacterium]